MESDERFKHVSTDPKFRHIPKKDKKVKIDKRFRGMFEDEKFKIKYTVDKRGRPVNHTSDNDLKRYYDMSSDSDESEDETKKSDDSEDETKKSDESEDETKKSDESEDETKKSEVSEDENAGKFVRTPKKKELKKSRKGKAVPDDIKKKLKDLSVDYARGEGYLNSDSSSSDEEDSEEEESESDVDHGWGELDRDAERTDEVTNRLAVCNMDWDRIRATDLMVLFNSFLPPGGHIKSITIYPSEFGLQRLKEEEVKGPIELVEWKNKHTDEETEEGAKYHMEKLRQYQLNRLKYYYAVLVLDSPETANKIYTECDGLEYESSSTKIDLRFIPDDTTFDHEPKESCDKLPDMGRYQPRFFTTTALQQAKVDLTWDETNPERIEIAKKFSEGKVDDITDADLQAYLASSSGEEESYDNLEEENGDDVNPIDKYRALLQEIETKNEEKANKGVEMEISWGVGVKEDAEKLVKKKLQENEEKTPFQQYLDKRKEKRKKLKEEKKKLKEGNDESEDIDSDQDIDMNDPYFAEEFNNPEFKKKKNKNKKQESDHEDDENDQEKAKLELLLLDNDDGKKHFNLKKLEKQESNKKKKKKNKKDNTEETNETDDFEVDVKDARFSAIFSSHHFNIDPTDARYRKTKAMEKLIEEKQKRIGTDDNIIEDLPPTKKPKAELKALVNSVKRKTKNLIKNK